MFGRKFDKFANFHTHLLANLGFWLANLRFGLANLRFVFHIKRE